MRAWLVRLIADGIREADQRRDVRVTLAGKDIVTSIRKLQRRNGRGGMAV